MPDWDKQPASRPNVYQNLSFASGPAPAQTCTAFGKATQQIRVMSTINGWVTFSGNLSGTTVTSNNIPGTGIFFPASTAIAEYYAVTPGQTLSFCSTAASSGYVSITEMA